MSPETALTPTPRQTLGRGSDPSPEGPHRLLLPGPFPPSLGSPLGAVLGLRGAESAALPSQFWGEGLAPPFHTPRPAHTSVGPGLPAHLPATWAVYPAIVVVLENIFYTKQ